MRLVTSIYDPLVSLRIGNQTIKAPLSHPLREILLQFPQFGFNLTRLIKYTHGQYPALTVIDIGANIGDTVAFINNYQRLPVLCIDGDARYLNLLKANIRDYPEVFPCLALLSDKDEERKKELIRSKGTASLQDSGVSISFRTLDTLLKDYPVFQGSKFLKTDTDGYDTVILRGGRDYILREQPVLFFEYDPGLIVRQQGENPLGIFEFLRECGYEFVLVYQNTGDYLLALNLVSDTDILTDLANYYMGRQMNLYGDLCVFSRKDKILFENARREEIAYFARFRNFDLIR
jgi:FkbM family methyltransferase